MSAETATRPFQVGDRVRITCTAQGTHEGTVTSIEPGYLGDSGPIPPYLWIETEPYTMSNGARVAIAHVTMSDDLSAAEYFGQSIELLEPAAVDPAAVKVGDTVTLERPSSNDRVEGVVNDASPEGFVLDGWGKRFRLGDDHDGLWTLTGHQPAPTDAPQDHGPLAAPLSDRTLAKVLSRPAHVPRETPSLVEMDQRDEVRSLLAGAIWISTGGVGNLYDFGHTYAVDPFLAADAILARFEVKAVQS